MKSFKGKVAIITGAGGTGMGNALANQLSEAGADIAICDIVNLEKTVNEVASNKGRCYHEIVDMGNKKAIAKFVENVLKEFGHVDILINNAGIALGDRNFEDITEEDFEKITNINYWGVVHTTQLLYKHMLTRPEAALVNLSSTQGILAAPYLIPYCTTKFAVRGFTDSLRIEHQMRDIKHFTVHTVHPGAVATDITRNADYQSKRSEKFHETLQKGASASDAARIILKGVQKNTERIFISDGAVQDLLARLLPTKYHYIVRMLLKMKMN